MKEFLAQHIHSGWRQALGLFLIVFSLASASFYYIDQHTLIKDSILATMANNSTLLAKQESVTAKSATITSPSAAPTPVQPGKIKISTATQAELENLPLIGPAKAKAIIEYRSSHPFKSVNDLTKVKGIGSKTLDKLKPLIEL